MKKFLFALLLAFAVSLPALALDLGDPAPEISPDKWVTGEPADPAKLDGTTFYLVEVWSTTCPPCVRTIPILNELQKRYAGDGLKIVSFTADAIDDVEPFLKEHPIEYSSFIDKDNATIVNYMAADNRNTIPHAFLFDRSGAMVWTGNPLDNIEARVKGVIDGSLNREKAVSIRDAKEAFESALASQDIGGLLSSLEKLEEIEPDNPQYYQVHFRILTELGAGDDEEVAALFNSWYKGCYDQPEALVVLSMVTLGQGHPGQRNPELALAAAKRAYELGTINKVEGGLALLEIYKDIGRLDLAMKVIGELKDGASTSELEILDAVEKFYGRLETLGKNPDAEYKPE